MAIYYKQIFLEDLENGGYSPSTEDDCSFICIGLTQYYKTNANEWTVADRQGNIISNPITNQQILGILMETKERVSGGLFINGKYFKIEQDI